MIERVTNQTEVTCQNHGPADKELRTLTIDPEFHDLIPPLTAEERSMLEDNLMKHGCDTPLAVWNDVIVDGHNRYAICHEHGIPFAVSEKEFESRDGALLWIITNQLGRRNLTSYQRGELILKFEPLLKAKAKERQLRKPANDNFVTQNSASQNTPFGETRKQLAKMAGVSHDTIHKVKKLTEAAGEEAKQKLRRNEMSINKAYTEVMHREHAQETRNCTCCHQDKPVIEFRVPSKRHEFSPVCKACEKEAAEASKQAAEVARKTQEPVEPQTVSVQPVSAQSLSSVAMHKGHPIHVGAPFPDRPEMFAYLEDHVRLITDNFLASAANAMRMYTPGMASPENTKTLREILESACSAVKAFDEYMKEMQDHE